MRVKCGVALAFLVLSSAICFGQFIQIEGTIRRADGVPLGGVSVVFSDGSIFATDNAGHYFGVLPTDFTGTVEPQREGIAFTPGKRTYSNVVTDQLAQDFMGGSYSVSGIVTGGGPVPRPIPGIPIFFDGIGQGAVTGGDGKYSISIPQGVSGVATPLGGLTSFVPPSRLYSSSSGENQNYSLGQYILSTSYAEVSNITWPACSTPDGVYLYPPSTPQIYATAFMSGNPGDMGRFSWFDPNGTVRETSVYTFPPAPGESGYCIQSSLAIAGTSAAMSPGLWSVSFNAPSISAYATQGSFTFAILSPQPPPAPSVSGSMAQLVSGGGWDTALQVVNTNTAPAQSIAKFFADDGSALALPLAAPYSRISTSVSPMLPSNAIQLVDSAGPDGTLSGSVQLSGDGRTSGFARLHFSPNGEEASVPLELRNADAYTLTFDNTNSLVAGVALTNLTGAVAEIPVVFRDDAGNQILADSITLPPNGHEAFVLSNQFASSANRAGTVEFDTPPGGRISVLGLRFNSAVHFTTIPVISSADPGGGTMAHLVAGGGWTTAIELVNTGNTVANTTMSLFADDGNPLALPIQLSTGGSSTTSTVSQSIPAHGRLVITSTANSDSAIEGSAQLVTDGRVSGYLRFSYAPTAQEAVVPIENRNGAAYVLAFDNTNGVATGVAIANASNSTASVPVVVRDDSGAEIDLGTLSLPANGHTAFVLSSQFPSTAAKTGTITFGVPVGQPISAIGLRFTPSIVFSTIPILAP